jgi:Family of unknown function (DUF6221)
VLSTERVSRCHASHTARHCGRAEAAVSWPCCACPPATSTYEHDEGFTLSAGGRYKIAAPSRRAGRGLSVDLLYIDELRDPARVLREVEAKRKILAEHRLDDMVPGVCYRCRYGVPAHWESTPYPCPTLRALAAVYAGHPDYDPAWT